VNANSRDVNSSRRPSSFVVKNLLAATGSRTCDSRDPSSPLPSTATISPMLYFCFQPIQQAHPRHFTALLVRSFKQRQRFFFRRYELCGSPFLYFTPTLPLFSTMASTTADLSVIPSIEDLYKLGQDEFLAELDNLKHRGDGAFRTYHAVQFNPNNTTKLTPRKTAFLFALPTSSLPR